jgi:hypothetical protein
MEGEDLVENALGAIAIDQMARASAEFPLTDRIR